MKSYGFEMLGPFLAETLPTLPEWTSDDVGREIYIADEQKRYFADSTSWVQYTDFEPGTIMLFGNSSAPVGWTRKSDWQDNAMLCYSASVSPVGGGAINPQSTHTHTGPSHTHTGPSHVHTMGTHTHTGPSHNHQWYNFVGITDLSQSFNSSGSLINLSSSASLGGRHIEAGGTEDDSLHEDKYTSNAGTGATGATDPGDTGSSGTAATGASGTAATGASTAPHFQEVIAAVKD